MKVTGYVKIPEVEFPDVALAGAKIGKITVGVRDCKADLDEVKDVDIGLEEDVVDGRGRLRGVRKSREGTNDDAGELRVHGDEWKEIDYRTDQLEFMVEIGRPNAPDFNGGGSPRGIVGGHGL